MNISDTTREASTLGKYFLGKVPSKAVVDKYVYYSSLKSAPDSSSDRKNLQFALKYPGLIPFLDAGLALVNPHSDLRRRLYAMFAILESDMEYTDLFLAQKRSAFYLFILLFTGISAVLKAIIGILLLKLVIK